MTVFRYLIIISMALNDFENIEGRITESWLVNEEALFLICLVKRAELLAHYWSSGRLATAYSIGKVLLKISETMASRFEIVYEEYIEELKDKSESENTKKSTSTGRTFSKIGRWKKLPSKFRRVRVRCPRPNTVAVLCRVTKRRQYRHHWRDF